MAAGGVWIPAFAGMTVRGGDDGGGVWLTIAAECGGMAAGGVWIPAFAGMTVGGGNDG